jgi:uncharacterized membrane protein
MSLLVDAIQIGAVRNGKVSITVPDENKGVYKTLSVSQDSADSFLSQRMNIEKKANSYAIGTMAAGTAIGAIIGAMKRVGECSSRGSNAGMGGELNKTI